MCFDAAHVRKLVKGGRWEDAGDYMDRFAPLWEGEGTSQCHATFMHTLRHHAMLDYLACRGDDGGRTASSLFCNDNAAFREKFPEVAQRHDLYRSMASKQARYAIKSMAKHTPPPRAWGFVPVVLLVPMSPLSTSSNANN